MGGQAKSDGVYSDVYDIQQELGKGNFGFVHQVTHKDTGRKFAMKHINLRKLKNKGNATVAVYVCAAALCLFARACMGVHGCAWMC